MKKPREAIRELNRRLARLRSASGLEWERALDLADHMTGTGRKIASELEAAGDYDQASEVYTIIAKGWRHAIDQLPPERQPNFKAVMDYWDERNQASAKMAALRRAAAQPTPAQRLIQQRQSPGVLKNSALADSGGPPPTSRMLSPANKPSAQSGTIVTRLGRSASSPFEASMRVKGATTVAPLLSKGTKAGRS